MTVLYGTNTANGTLTNACNLVTSTGASETSKTTTFTGTNIWAEIFSQGGSTATVSSVGSPSGHGWTYQPGAGTYATGNWSASITLSSVSKAINLEIRFYKYSGGSYTSIGTITLTSGFATAKTTYSMPATSMSSVTFGSSDLLYADLWWMDNSSNAGGDNPTVYIGNSSTAGVSGDMQITTSTFTPSGITNSRTIPASAALQSTTGRTIPASAALQGTSSRTIPASAALTVTHARTIPASAALGTTISRTIPASAALIVEIVSGGFTLFANGTGTASFDHFRVTQYPDPALSLAPVTLRLGSSLANWDATTPTNTTLAVATSLDAVTWSTATNGSAIAGLSSQPDPTIDIFSSNTSANYTQSHFGSTNPSWTWDTTNSRLIGTGGTGYNGLLLANTVSSFADGSVIADLDEADGSGFALRCNGSSTMYALYLYDASASASANIYILYKIVSGAFTQLATGSITFTRGTVYRFKMEASGSTITAWMDGVQLCSVTDSTIASGQVAYVANTLLQSYQLRIQPYGSYVTGTPPGDIVTATFLYSKQTLTTSDPSVNPQGQDLTLSARSPQIATGALITQMHDPSKPFAEYFDKEIATLVQNSGDYYSDIDNSGALTFAARHATPAPWVLQSSDLELQFTPTVTPTGDASLYRNRQTITNCIGLVTIGNEEKIADGTATSWQLAYPLYSAPTITVQGVSKTVGVQGVDTGKDFYWQAATNSISQDSSAAKIPSGYVLSFSYTGQYTKNVTRDNLAEQAAHALIATGTTGIVEAWEDGKGMLESNAITYADGLLARFGNPDPVELTGTTRRPGLAKGQMLPVFLSALNLHNRQLLIIKITTTGEQQADGSVLYYYAIDATDGPNVNNWGSALI